MFFLSSGVKVSILWDMALSQVSKVTGLSTLGRLSNYTILKCQAQIID